MSTDNPHVEPTYIQAQFAAFKKAHKISGCAATVEMLNGKHEAFFILPTDDINYINEHNLIQFSPLTRKQRRLIKQHYKK